MVSELPGYRGLDGTARGRFDTLLTGPTNGLSYRPRNETRNLVAGIGPDARGVQTKELDRFVRAGSYLLEHVSSLADPGPQRRGTLGAARSLGSRDFQGTSANGSTRSIQVGGRTIQLIYPDTPPSGGDGRTLPKPEEVANELARLPTQQLGAIKSVTLSPVDNPSDEIWSKRHDIAKFKSAATAGPAGHVTIYPSRWTGGLTLEHAAS